MKLSSVLVANRGEVACRILRTARRLGLRSVAVFSEADAGAPHTRLADQAVCIGPAAAAESYLSIPKLIAAAHATGSECIHPGYGFLSENPDFARACAEAGVLFVGPSETALRSLGDKGAAKALMKSVGAPVLPGYSGTAQDDSTLAERAREIGYPILIKAESGGGGRGHRLARTEDDLTEALAAARRETRAAFGDERLLLERYVERPRHVEVQVIGDAFGASLHLGERDCSAQRRRQKIVEEAPGVNLSSALRRRLREAALDAVRAVGYVGVGTVEFLLSSDLEEKTEAFWFIEMNPRLQVEHCVTEAVCGLDLVELQLRVAAGEPLAVAQDRIRTRGYAIEARICAEDPARSFLPSSGRIVALRLPDAPDVRVECGVEEGSLVTSDYDSLLAKLIAWAPSRAQAIARLRGALAATVVLGPATNVAFLDRLLASPEFEAGRVDVDLAERLPADEHPQPAAAALALCAELDDAARRARAETDPWAETDAFQVGPARRSAVAVRLQGEPVEFFWTPVEGGRLVEAPAVAFSQRISAAKAAEAIVVADGDRRLVWLGLRQTEVLLSPPADGRRREAPAGWAAVSPMPGRLARLFVEPGRRVEPGEVLAIVEAMKMEHALKAETRAQVVAAPVREGDQVSLGQTIVELLPLPPDTSER